MTVVELVGGAIVVPALSQDANVLVSPSADFNTLHASAVALAAAPGAPNSPPRKTHRMLFPLRRGSGYTATGRM